VEHQNATGLKLRNPIREIGSYCDLIMTSINENDIGFDIIREMPVLGVMMYLVQSVSRNQTATLQGDHLSIKRAEGMGFLLRVDRV
jgi:hypothetical protein